MKFNGRFVAALLASVSTLGISYAYAADASMPASAPEVLSVTAQDQQSAGGGGSTSNVGTIDVQGAGTALGNGYIVPEDGPKDRSTVTHAGIENLLPTVNPFQAIGILPGVNQQQDDALGLSGGTIRVRGLVASQMGFTINGVPLNDSGTFNVYPQEFIDTENVSQIWVTQGSTDIDAPHVGASGGNIGIVTRAPLDTFNVKAEELVGYDALTREFVSLDTGWIGDFKGFASFSQVFVDKWRGDGNDSRMHSDGNLLWQFMPHSSLGLTWAYNDAVNDYYRDYALVTSSAATYNVGINGKTALQTFNEIGGSADYDTFWGSSAAFPIYRSGVYNTGSCATHPNPACTVANPDYPAQNVTNVSNYYGLQINPYRNVVVNSPLHLQLDDNLRWDTNGYVWYGTGGAGFGDNIQENGVTNGFLVGSVYGDPANSTNEILTYENTTNRTFRPGVTSKVTYDWENFTFLAGGWFEHSRLAQEEGFGQVNPNATPCDIWMGNYGGNPCSIYGTSGFGAGNVYAYKYVANTIGKSAFVEVQSRFFDDSLKITAGVADRAITRSIHNMNPICADDPSLATSNPAAAGTHPTCASYASSTTFLESSAFPLFGGVYGTPSTYAPAYAAMQRYAQNPHVGFSAWLPEFNLSYDIDPFQQVFAGLSTGFRTPSASNFTQFTSGASATSSNIMKLTDIKSEYDYSYEAGYRYHGDFVTASATAYLQDVRDYQASVQIDPADYITSNIGTVKIYGIDFEAGTKPWHGFTFYGSAELQNSVLSQNVQSDYNTSAPFGAFPNDAIEYVYSRGKRLVDTPNWIVSASVGYSQDGFFGSLTPQCKGDRPTALNNDEMVPSHCSLDATVGYHFSESWGYLKGAVLQAYIINAFDSSYFGEIYTQGQTNAKPAAGYEIDNATHAVTKLGPGSIFPESYSGEPGSPLFIGVKLSIDVGQ